MKLVEAKKVEGCKCVFVRNFDQVKKDADKMEKIMIDGHGIGLAAPQVGIFKRFFIMKDFRLEGVVVIINPEIMKYSDKIGTFREGCLTYPGEEFIIKRPKYVLARWSNLGGVEVYRKMTGKESQVFQHEFDHLDGISCKMKRETA